MSDKKLPTLEAASISQGTVVLVRIDCNVPLNEDGTIADTYRLDSVTDTLQYLKDKQAKVVIAGAIGRPKGKRDDSLSTKVIAQYFEQNIFESCAYIDQCCGEKVKELIASTANGNAIMLENLRFFEGEETNDDEFAKSLSELADIYVNDAFGQSHRNQASIVAITNYLPSYAGKCLQREVDALIKVLSGQTEGTIAIVGGSKVSDKLGVIEALLERCDKILVGGAMAYTFLKAQGKKIGNSLCEDSYVDKASQWLATNKIVLPIDSVIASDINSTDTSVAKDIDEGYAGFDIGPESVELFSQELENAGLVLWNGPMGVFEKEQFANGTNSIARLLASSSAFTVIGGGDSVAAIRELNLQDSFSHVSTGGGATLEYIESGTLVGVQALLKRRR